MKAAAVARPKNPRVGRDTYFQNIDGMLFGDDPQQGIVKGNLFQHPILQFQFQVPEDFRIVNGQSQVVAQNRSGAAILFDTAPIKGSREMAPYLQNEWTAKTQLRDVENIKINGLDAATGWARGKNQSGQTIDIRAVAIRNDNKSAYRFMFVNPAKDSQKLAKGYQKTTYSFRRLSQAEASKIKALRLLLVPASKGDTVRGLSKTLPYGKYNETWFRVLNDMKPQQPLQPNQRLKVVAA